MNRREFLIASASLAVAGATPAARRAARTQDRYQKTAIRWW